MGFLGKKRQLFEFTLLHHVLSELFKNSILPLEIHFCYKKQGSTLTFFLDFDKNSFIIILGFF